MIKKTILDTALKKKASPTAVISDEKHVRKLELICDQPKKIS